MDELKQLHRIRIAPFLTPSAAVSDDPDQWMGGEASVGTQAGRHVRRSERSRPGLPLTILGLAFFGGLVLGTVVSSLLRKTAR